MQTYQDKINLLQEMISFALVDGDLHNKEYDFIEMIAIELNVAKPELISLFENKNKTKVIKDEFTRICQFYRLALLMFSDEVIHPKEVVKINQISLHMGLNPHATKRVLQLLEKSPNKMVDGEVLISMFTEQYN
jgi:hypothetical protein